MLPKSHENGTPEKLMSEWGWVSCSQLGNGHLIPCIKVLVMSYYYALVGIIYILCKKILLKNNIFSLIFIVNCSSPYVGAMKLMDDWMIDEILL